jgi:hypothetical protein
VGDHPEGGLGPEDRVTTLSFASFHGFEEKRGCIPSIRSDQTPVGQDRSKLVVEKADAQGDDKGEARI